MSEAGSVTHLLFVLAALLATAKLLGALVQRAGQPAVLGELAAGVILGGSVLGLLDPADPVIHALSELGVIILLFEIGLHTDLRSLAKVAGTATIVGLTGVILPFVLGYFAASVILGLDVIPAVVCGAALTATSVGISARVLADIDQLDTREGQVVLGAAVFDDVVGLVILSVVGSVVLGSALTATGVITTTVVAFGFIAVALTAGKFLAPPAFRALERMRAPGALSVIALAFAFLLSALAARAGSAMIIGAFSAGLILNRTRQRGEIERATTTIGLFLVPVFFASVGAAVKLSAFSEPATLAAGALLIVAGVIGKFASGYAPMTFTGNKRLIGAAMIPRGEVGLIFAQMGLATGALTSSLFSALTLMVMVTTFLAPPLLVRLGGRRLREAESLSGDGGIDDLVTGDLSHESPRPTGQA